MIRRIVLFGRLSGRTEALVIGEAGPGMRTGESFMSMLKSMFTSMFTSMLRFTLRFMLTLRSFFGAVSATKFSDTTSSSDGDCELHLKLDSFCSDVEEVYIED